MSWFAINKEQKEYKYIGVLTVLYWQYRISQENKVPVFLL